VGSKAEKLTRQSDDCVARGPEADRECHLRRLGDDDGQGRRVGYWGEGGARILTAFHMLGLEIVLDPVRNDPQLQNKQQERGKPRMVAQEREHRTTLSSEMNLDNRFSKRPPSSSYSRASGANPQNSPHRPVHWGAPAYPIYSEFRN
jgi:hypothetical protein